VLLEDGVLQRQAGRITMLWHRATDKRVGQLRHSEAVRSQARAVADMPQDALQGARI
jgi:hypothetical protein